MTAVVDYECAGIDQYQQEGIPRKLVRVGPGFLEFHFGGEPVRVTKAEIASVSLGSGTFSFKHNDARWFSRAGKFSFSYGRMANARVFMLALDKLMGYRWN